MSGKEWATFLGNYGSDLGLDTDEAKANFINSDYET